MPKRKDIVSDCSESIFYTLGYCMDQDWRTVKPILIFTSFRNIHRHTECEHDERDIEITETKII